MNIRTLDLNLLRVFAAIFSERNVSAAARRENLTQPAVSNALARLRKSFDDALFVKTASGMEPTALALELIVPVREALTILEKGLQTQGGFDPLHATRVFRLLLSDAGESILLPPLIGSVIKTSPGIGFEVVRVPHERYAEALQTGTADLAIGNLPFLRAGFERRKLFSDPYCVIMRRNHPLSKKPLDLDTFAAARHAAIATGNSDALVDGLLARRRKKRHIMVKVSHYHVAVDVVAGSDLLATVPRIVAAGAKDIRALDLPIKVAPADIHMVWHRTRHHDAANQWLRMIVAALDLHGSVQPNKPPLRREHS